MNTQSTTGFRVSMPGNEMLFHIMMFNEQFITYTKSEILKKVNDSYFHGLCELELVEQTVIDARHIDIMRKLYSMATDQKIKGWIEKLDEFKKAPLRSHVVCKELIASFEELKTLPDDAGKELRDLHKIAETEYKHLLTLRF